MIKYIYIINLFSTIFMTGLIWCIQVVHYPLFEKVGKAGFTEYHSLHSMKISFIVLPVMCAEIFTAFLLLGENEFLSTTMSFILFGMVLVIWGSTFFLQVPYHSLLSSGWNEEYISKLVNTNWVRTIFWSLRTGLLSYFLLKKLP